MKHLVFTRARFCKRKCSRLCGDKELIKKYLHVAKSSLIPSFHAQTNKDFTWVIFTQRENASFLKKELDYPFIIKSGYHEYLSYVKDSNINIQTRHDMDDYMSPDYIETIQKEYKKSIKTKDSFIIHFQPIKHDLYSGEEYSMRKFTDKHLSMFLSLCALKPLNHVMEHGHLDMWKITQNIIYYSEGYVKLNVHENNVSSSTLWPSDKKLTRKSQINDAKTNAREPNK